MKRFARSYEKGITDEFIEPITIVDPRNEPVGLIRDYDSVVMYNYRADRAREMTLALTDAVTREAVAILVPKGIYLHNDDPVRQNFRACRLFCRLSIRTTFSPT